MAAAVAVAAGGCGLGPGPSTEGEATLTVTRDYGRQMLLDARASEPPESETVLRLLDGEAEITTRYGGGFVQSIDGVAGGTDDGHRSDWFFFVNGIESDRGAAEVEVRGGDRIWWDYRDGTDALRTPAVVGSWPEPFAQAATDDDRLAVEVVCAGEDKAPQRRRGSASLRSASRPTCDAVAERLAEEGVDAAIHRAGREPRDEALRLLVGPWPEINDDPATDQLDAGPQTSGVFARFAPGPGGLRLLALDQGAEPVARLGGGAALVAAVRDGDEPPTWLVTGTDAAGVRRAVSLLSDDRLAHRYAVAAVAGDVLPLPAEEG
jgi:hypothetical protein